MDEILVLKSTHYVHLKENGEICNRLARRTRVHIVKRKGEWLKITWRNGRKKGWICVAE